MLQKPFHVNFFDVQKKNLYRLLLCGRGAGPDKIYFLRERAGVGQNLVGGSGTEKSIPRRSLVLIVSILFIFKFFYELLTNVLFLHLFQS